MAYVHVKDEAHGQVVPMGRSNESKSLRIILDRIYVEDNEASIWEA